MGVSVRPVAVCLLPARERCAAPAAQIWAILTTALLTTAILTTAKLTTALLTTALLTIALLTIALLTTAILTVQARRTGFACSARGLAARAGSKTQRTTRCR
jgi:hypothetical protein